MPETLHRSAASAAEEAGLRFIGEELGALVRSFDEHGLIGVIAIDTRPLATIEAQFGGEAHRRCIDELGRVIHSCIGSRLREGDRVVRGEAGCDEVLVLLFRGPSDVAFYPRELPELRRRVADELTRKGSRIAYPYLRQSPPLDVGSGAALRNPTIGAERQIGAAIQEARAEAELERRLASRQRRAQIFDLVLRGDVYSVYEPIVDVATRTVFGYEALTRGPEGSDLHTPGALFASADEQDLLFQLDCLCRQSGLAGACDLPSGVKLFLNVRPTSIHDPNFRADALIRTLAKTRLRPSDVVFEISEQESISNFEIFREVRDQYRRLGIQIALDDMGSGYSSLEAVMELSPDYIKVDRTFVSGIDSDPARQEVLRAMRSVAERIQARIIGEGLDTLEELAMLGELGIPFGQGWLFGKPTPLRASD